MDYSKKTVNLIDRMCHYVERKDFKLNKELAEEKILKTYDIFNLPRPKNIIWCIDIFDQKFGKAARSARSAGLAGSARAARSAGSALDYDFDWFVIEYEYCINRKDNLGDEPNENDKKYLEYLELLLEALEAGLGYRIEWENTLYLVPTPIVRIDNQNRFHSVKEPSIKWKNGKEFYYLNGINFEKQWWEKIVKGQLSPEEIFAINNQEHRRIAYEYMDKSKMKQLKDYTILDEQIDDLGKLMKIFSFKVKGINEPLKYYQCVDASTDREYFIGTDKSTCKEAKEASFGLSDVEWEKEW